jgi:hypothetical protein
MDMPEKMTAWRVDDRMPDAGFWMVDNSTVTGSASYIRSDLAKKMEEENARLNVRLNELSYEWGEHLSVINAPSLPDGIRMVSEELARLRSENERLKEDFDKMTERVGDGIFEPATEIARLRSDLEKAVKLIEDVKGWVCGTPLNDRIEAFLQSQKERKP